MSVLSKKLKEDIIPNIRRAMGINPLVQLKSSFSVVAVRCNSDESVGKRNLVAGKIYYLLDGYSVEGGDGKFMMVERKNLNNLYDDYLFAGDGDHPHVQVSAIVGENGAGKSSLVEFIMRLINNFSAMLFGERKIGNTSERLHFINGVDGDLWYVNDRHLYRLHVKNSHVALFHCGNIKEGESLRISEESQFSMENPNMSGTENVLDRKDDNEIRSHLENFFYTIVSNYSLYAYNSNDFRKECDSVVKAMLAGDSGDEWLSIEQRCWLNGLFHKNDGYQMPMVITPFRSTGNININKENSLARERLISLLVLHDEYRHINGHLTAYGLVYWRDGSKKYGIDRIKKELGLKRLTDKGYSLLRSSIVKQWGNSIGVNLNQYKLKVKPFYELALDYLVFKTLKISYTYWQHNKNYIAIVNMRDRVPRESVEKMVASQVQDLSHITKKLHQTLAYLIYDVYSSEIHEDDSPIEVDFENIKHRWQSVPKKCLDSRCSELDTAIATQALIPPPFMQSRLDLRVVSEKNTRIDFETLSSGEKQQIYTISSLLYHLDNLNSVKEDKSSSTRIPYQNIFLILEEVELYFHPELQRQFVKQLLDGIHRIDLSNIKAIHIVIVTHSPYVLSDIPRGNVLALQKGKISSDGKLKTFCANIHEMLKDSFFLSHGSQGAFAQWEIGHLVACIDIHRRWKSRKENEDIKEEERWYSFVKEMRSDDSDLYRFASRYISQISNYPQLEFSYEDFCLDFSEEKLRQRISIIDEPLVRQVLFRELDDVFAKTQKERILAQIAELKRELQQLKSE